jgi:hypothetical protein
MNGSSFLVLGSSYVVRALARSGRLPFVLVLVLLLVLDPHAPEPSEAHRRVPKETQRSERDFETGSRARGRRARQTQRSEARQGETSVRRERIKP